MSAIDRDLSLALAKAQANLDLVASRFDILSDLGDLKEFKKLEAECKLTIRELAATGRVPADPLASLESELVHLCEWAKEVKALVHEADSALQDIRLRTLLSDRDAGRIGTKDIQAQLHATRTLLLALPSRCELMAARCPTSCILGTNIDPRVAEIWSLRVNGRTRGWAGLGKKLPDVARLRAWVDSTGGSANEGRNKISVGLEERLRLLQKWESESVAEGNDLAEALRQLERGHPRIARALLARPRSDRFEHPIWKMLSERLEALEDALGRVKLAPDSRASFSMARRLRLESSWSKVEAHSEFGARLSLFEASAQRSLRNKKVAFIAGLVVLIACGGLAKRSYDEEQRLQAVAAAGKARAAAGKARAEAEAKAEAAARAKAVLERLQSEGKMWQVADVGLSMVPISAGSFRMGSEAGSGDERPITSVTLSAFWLARTEVTQAQWKAVMRNNPSRFEGDALPVENVSWDDAMDFCRKLTERERAAGRLPAELEYTLPTEAQWEYACRAGTTGDHAGVPDTVAWYSINSGSSTHAVATKAPNAWGLYDMHGNVWEWCRDWYGSYLGGSVTDPTGPASGSDRVYRGGSWLNGAGYCRSAFRRRSSPVDRGGDLGFRPALSSVP